MQDVQTTGEHIPSLHGWLRSKFLLRPKIPLIFANKWIKMVKECVWTYDSSGWPSKFSSSSFSFWSESFFSSWLLDSPAFFSLNFRFTGRPINSCQIESVMRDLEHEVLNLRILLLKGMLTINQYWIFRENMWRKRSLFSPSLLIGVCYSLHLVIINLESYLYPVVSNTYGLFLFLPVNVDLCSLHLNPHC